MTNAALLHLPVDEIVPDMLQPRQDFDPDSIERMAASIRSRGVLQPIRVRWDASRSCWILICGETRWRGAKQAGLATVPALPVENSLSEIDILSDQLIENVIRDSLPPMSLARSLDKLKRLKHCTSKELAAEIGLSGGSISRAEALLTLPEDIQALIDNGTISPAAGYELSRLPDDASRREMAHAVASGRISRDRTAEAVREIVGKRKSPSNAARLPLSLPSGVRVTVSAASMLTWESLLAALEQIRKQAEALKKSGGAITDLPKSLAS